MRDTRLNRFDDFPRLYEPQNDPFGGMLTPSRDHWHAVVLDEVLELIEASGLTEREKAEQLVAIIEREKDRHTARER